MDLMSAATQYISTSVISLGNDVCKFHESQGDGVARVVPREDVIRAGNYLGILTLRHYRQFLRILYRLALAQLIFSYNRKKKNFL